MQALLLHDRGRGLPATNANSTSTHNTPLFHNNLQAYSELLLPTSHSSPLFSAALLSTARTLFSFFYFFSEP
jgi:hypothetical protein